MASQTQSAGLGQSIVGAGGVVHWANPTNIYTSNNVYASAGLQQGECSYWLRATNFGFSIPAGSIIDGIVVEIERVANRINIRDNSVKIVKAGSEQGTDKAVAGDWPTTDAYQTYGGSTDKWGLTWTPAQINASNFGVSISAEYYGTFFLGTAYVDHIRITVYYTEPSTNMKINIGDAWKDVDEVKINIGDSWKTVTQIQVNISDAWKTVFG